MSFGVENAVYGNPWEYSTFTDEGINKLLKAVAGAARRSVWEARVFQLYPNVEAVRSKLKRSLGQAD